MEQYMYRYPLVGSSSQTTSKPINDLMDGDSLILGFSDIHSPDIQPTISKSWDDVAQAVMRHDLHLLQRLALL